MLQFDLNAQVRGSFGKGASRSMRRAGLTPAILYGPKTEPLALQFNTKDLTKSLLTLQRRNAVFAVDVDDSGSTSKRHVMLKAVQTNPINDTLVHADFIEVALDQPITLQVPVSLLGKAKGVDLGGDLSVTVKKVALKGQILDIPDLIERDISDLAIGESLSCKDLAIPENIELLNDPEQVCVAVLAARESREEDEEGGEEAVVEEAAAE